jgi:hypothetical protein
VGVFDVAVVVLAVGVCGSLGLLAWTLGIASGATIERARREVNAARDALADAEARVAARSAAIHAALARVQGDR